MRYRQHNRLGTEIWWLGSWLPKWLLEDCTCGCVRSWLNAWLRRWIVWMSWRKLRRMLCWLASWFCWEGSWSLGSLKTVNKYFSTSSQSYRLSTYPDVHGCFPSIIFLLTITLSFTRSRMIATTPTIIIITYYEQIPNSYSLNYWHWSLYPGK